MSWRGVERETERAYRCSVGRDLLVHQVVSAAALGHLDGRVRVLGGGAGDGGDGGDARHGPGPGFLRMRFVRTVDGLRGFLAGDATPGGIRSAGKCEK